MTPPRTVAERLDEHDVLIYKMMRTIVKIDVKIDKLAAHLGVSLAVTDSEIDAVLDES